MCWNQTVSLNTFVFGLFAVLFAYSNNVLSLSEGMFYMTFISMQLVEYFTWKHLDNKKINRLLSQIALSLILLQLPMLIIAYDYDNKYKYLLLFIYLLVVVYIITTTEFDFSMTKASNHHLHWNWNTLSNLFVVVYVIVGGSILLYKKKYFVFAFILMTNFISIYTYSASKTIGSMWCWLVNGISIYLIYKVFYNDFCTLPNGTLF